MKSYFVATAIVLAAHVAVGLLWPPYFHLWVGCGAMLSHGNDIADMPRQGLLGGAMTGSAWLAVAIGAVAYVEKS